MSVKTKSLRLINFGIYTTQHTISIYFVFYWLHVKLQHCIIWHDTDQMELTIANSTGTHIQIACPILVRFNHFFLTASQIITRIVNKHLKLIAVLKYSGSLPTARCTCRHRRKYQTQSKTVFFATKYVHIITLFRPCFYETSQQFQLHGKTYPVNIHWKLANSRIKSCHMRVTSSKEEWIFQRHTTVLKIPAN